MLVSKPYAARRSSTACRRPSSPVRFGEAEEDDVAEDLARISKMSIVLERRRENWSGVRMGERMVVWRGLFWDGAGVSLAWTRRQRRTGGGTYVAAYYADISYGGGGGCHGCGSGEKGGLELLESLRAWSIRDWR